MAISKAKVIIASFGILAIIGLLIGFSSFQTLPTANSINPNNIQVQQSMDPVKTLQGFLSTESSIIGTKMPPLP